jgi:hypothetical protein
MWRCGGAELFDEEAEEKKTIEINAPTGLAALQDDAFRSRLHLGFKPLKDPGGAMTACFKAALKAGMFPEANATGRTSADRPKQTDAKTEQPFRVDPNIDYSPFVKTWKDEMKQFKAKLAQTGNLEPIPQRREEPERPTLLNVARPALMDIAKQFKLNFKQLATFLIIGTRFLQELAAAELASDTTPFETLLSNKPLRHFTGGEGGTGKSHVIGALRQLFGAYGRSHWLLVVAPTGAAAQKISGNTIHSAFGIAATQPSSKHSRRAISGRFHALKDVRFLVVDEISMVSDLLLAEMSVVPNRVKNKESLSASFGCINVTLWGDFLQFEPVAGRSLAKAGTSRGRELWEEFTSVVFLNEQKRITHRGWLRLVTRLRFGEQLDDEDLAIIHDRIKRKRTVCHASQPAQDCCQRRTCLPVRARSRPACVCFNCARRTIRQIRRCQKLEALERVRPRTLVARAGQQDAESSWLLATGARPIVHAS